MLKTLQDIFERYEIETPANETIKIHSNTSKEQGLFLQDIFDLVKPQKSLEVGLAFGISALFILEKHKQYNNKAKSHIVIEPFPWGGVAEHNIEKEGLTEFADIRYEKSHDVLPKLYYENHRIQFAYVDTTKLFDIVFQDFYFIDKILDINGVIILDDCGGGWPGVQRVARFINTLPHYKLLKAHNKTKMSFKKQCTQKVISTIVKLVPFKGKFYSAICFKTDAELNLNYSCIAFQKISEDQRNWNFDVAI